MAIYKIFPEKSATLYSYYPTLNSGLDEILELSTFESIAGTNEISRPIIKFPQAEILDIINNKVNGASYSASLRLSLANASQIPLDYTIFCHPLAADWNIGNGRYSNSPITTDGVSWQFKDQLSGSVWFTAGNFPTGTTGSYISSATAGGGLWYTGSSYVSTQSFNHINSLDISLNVTNTVVAWSGSILPNYGFILKHSSSLEFTTASKFETKYFSAETHTIYPPCLVIKWNDWVYNTGSLSVISNDLFIPSLGNNKGEFQQDSVQRFRINVRDKFPARAFQTSSVYLNNKVLPTSSYWSIKDLDSEEIVVDYDLTYTKISCDASGSFFDVYMNGLQPERYYKLLFKTVLATGGTVISDNNYYFKVIR